MYFDQIYMDLISLFNGRIKVDNHPNIAWQYTSLYHYIVTLMNTLPIVMMQNDKEHNITKYKALDYDGKMESRMKLL